MLPPITKSPSYLCFLLTDNGDEVVSGDGSNNTNNKGTYSAPYLLSWRLGQPSNYFLSLCPFFSTSYPVDSFLNPCYPVPCYPVDSLLNPCYPVPCSQPLLSCPLLSCRLITQPLLSCPLFSTPAILSPAILSTHYSTPAILSPGLNPCYPVDSLLNPCYPVPCYPVDSFPNPCYPVPCYPDSCPTSSTVFSARVLPASKQSRLLLFLPQ